MLREYLVKGFTLNDDFLKNMGGGKYWQEFLPLCSNADYTFSLLVRLWVECIILSTF